ncbi:MAG: hypothetical protein LBL07_11540 [Tannerella sp.]|jgi:hypothetical protein|nr:hypothetical protein [Tannerella sp.]
MKEKERYKEHRGRGGACLPRRVFTVLLTLATVGGLRGQDSDRRWALRYTGDLLDRPVLTHRSNGASIGKGSSAFALMGEYYLRDKWSLTGGYFRTDMRYGDGHRSMEGARTGARRYFLDPDFPVQPYLSAATELNWGERTQRRTFGGSSGSGQNSYTGTQDAVNPRLSFIPSAGVDIYLLSFFALTVEYGFNMGIASRTEMSVTHSGQSLQVMRDRGMFHSLSMGAKMTFPITLTDDDRRGLLSLLWGLLFYDDRNYEMHNY